MPRLLILLIGFLSACSEHKVDTFPEWCEQISGVDLYEKYAPFWVVFPSVSFHGDAIRDSYTDFLNETHRAKVGENSPRMAWREGAQLHLINLSSFFAVEPMELIEEWRDGIESDITDKLIDPTDLCLYGTLTSMFDSLHIHSMEPDALGQQWTDSVTVIETDREERLGSRRL